MLDSFYFDEDEEVDADGCNDGTKTNYKNSTSSTPAHKNQIKITYVLNMHAGGG